MHGGTTHGGTWSATFGRRLQPLLGAWLLLVAASFAALFGALSGSAASEAAEYPVRPRPQCRLAPDVDAARLRNASPDCLGPLHGARPAPRRHAGRQQWRMRMCQRQASRHGWRGEQRARFLRHCLRRGR